MSDDSLHTTPHVTFLSVEPGTFYLVSCSAQLGNQNDENFSVLFAGAFRQTFQQLKDRFA